MSSRRTPEEIQAQRDPRADQSLREVDPALNAILEREAVRQRDHIELIASSTPRDTPGSATTPGVNTLTPLKISPAHARCNSSLGASM